MDRCAVYVLKRSKSPLRTTCERVNQPFGEMQRFLHGDALTDACGQRDGSENRERQRFSSTATHGVRTLAHAHAHNTSAFLLYPPSSSDLDFTGQHLHRILVTSFSRIKQDPVLLEIIQENGVSITISCNINCSTSFP